MDDLNVHKGQEVRQVIKPHGCWLYLPSYSPDFSLIEASYSTVKTRVRRAWKRTQGESEAAIEEAVEAVTASDAPCWFAHCSYLLSEYLN